MDKKTIKRLLSYCSPYKFLIISLAVLSIVSVIFTLLTPVLLGQAIDLLVGENQVDFQGLFNKLILYGLHGLSLFPSTSSFFLFRFCGMYFSKDGSVF